MTIKADLLARFTGQGSRRPLYLPDLTLWYDWHKKRGTLPKQWQDYTLPEAARAMKSPVWFAAQPRLGHTGVEIIITEQAGERMIRTETAAGTLLARWTLGPDGAWWQTAYPVKTAADLAAVKEMVQARFYDLNSDLADLEVAIGDDGLLAIEIPRRPLSDLLHEFLGWSEGLMLLWEEQSLIEEILAILEEKLQAFVQIVSQLPHRVILSPDNLDGQFISPRLFKTHLAASYRHTTEVLHEYDQHLLVHVGGPIKHLLAPLAEAGIDGLEGIAGPPQSDATLTEARQIVGPNVTLWGGVCQDFLVEAYDQASFEAAIKQALRQAADDPRVIIGVADRVPVDAPLSRLEAIPALADQAFEE